jgi:hypothetical protein
LQQEAEHAGEGVFHPFLSVSFVNSALTVAQGVGKVRFHFGKRGG